MDNSKAMDVLFGASSEITAGDNQLKSISALIQEESQAQSELETAEAMVESAKARVNDLRQKRIPEAMMEAGVAEFVDATTGCKAKLQLAVSGALGQAKTDEEKAARERKLDLLVANGAEEIVKLVVAVAFGKGKYDQAKALQEVLMARDNLPDVIQGMADAAAGAGKDQASAALKEASRRLGAVQGLLAVMERTVHHQTLISWIKKKMEAGAELPLDDLGMWYGQVAKIERPKAEG